MFQYEDGATLPLLYHLNSEPWLNLDAYAAVSAEVPFPARVAAADCIALPRPDGTSQMARALAQRRSCRRFAHRALAAATLAELLAGTYGIVEPGALANGTLLLRRPIPSAGALYPLTLYPSVQNVQDIPDGAYRYLPLHHRLEPVASRPAEPDLHRMLLAQSFISEANALVLMVAGFDRMLAKYGPRGYRYVLIEAGHAAQALCLLAGEAGLASLCIGGFRDSRVNAWLGLDGTHEAVVYGVALGWPDEAPAET